MRLPQDKILHIDTEFENGKLNVVAEWQGELVRCSECKHLHPSGMCEEFADDGIRPSATDFCSYGERKGDDTE